MYGAAGKFFWFMLLNLLTLTYFTFFGKIKLLLTGLHHACVLLLLSRVYYAFKQSVPYAADFV